VGRGAGTPKTVDTSVHLGDWKKDMSADESSQGDKLREKRGSKKMQQNRAARVLSLEVEAECEETSNTKKKRGKG